LYLTVKEECRQNAGSNKSLYIICGPKVDGITKLWRKNKEQLYNFNSSGSMFL